jgi:DNA polymerase III gamma/tau subunit
MYLNNPADLANILKKSHFVLFISPSPPHLKNTYLVPQPEKSAYSVEEIRKIHGLTRAKQLSPMIIQINNAENLSEPSQNAFLKLLEEPNTNISFLLHATEISKILPTIKSRAQIYYHASPPSPPTPRITALAKKLITADQPTLIKLSQDLAKDRETTLSVISAAISIITAAHQKSPTPKFTTKLEKLLTLHANITANGHIRLQILASML